MNSVVLVGRLGADPELSYTPGGMAVCTFRLAVDRPPRDGQEQEPNWFSVVCFERQAELAHQYLNRGALAGIEGRLQSRTWQREDGGRGYAVEVVAGRVAFLESRREREARQAAQPGGEPAQQPGPAGQPAIDWTLDETEDPWGKG